MASSALKLADPAARKAAFAQVFNRLAAAFGVSVVDAAKMQVYFEALGDVPHEAVTDAAAWWQRHGGKWFPSSAEWHARAEIERTERLHAAIEPAREAPWTHECQLCEDTGWSEFRCVGRGAGQPALTVLPHLAHLLTHPCERRTDHAGHTYVVPCACRAANETYQRKRVYERERLKRQK